MKNKYRSKTNDGQAISSKQRTVNTLQVAEKPFRSCIYCAPCSLLCSVILLAKHQGTKRALHHSCKTISSPSSCYSNHPPSTRHVIGLPFVPYEGGRHRRQEQHTQRDRGFGHAGAAVHQAQAQQHEPILQNVEQLDVVLIIIVVGHSHAGQP